MEQEIEDMSEEEMLQAVRSGKIRIRKLTPKECYRLMGFEDMDFDNVHNAQVSNSQAYKQAGNSICVNVLEAAFGQLFEGKENNWKRWLDKTYNEVEI